MANDKTMIDQRRTEVGIFHGARMTHGVAVVERIAGLLERVEELDVVLGLVGGVGDAPVELVPRLERLRLGHLQHA